MQVSIIIYLCLLFTQVCEVAGDIEALRMDHTDKIAAAHRTSLGTTANLSAYYRLSKRRKCLCILAYQWRILAPPVERRTTLRGPGNKKDAEVSNTCLKWFLLSIMGQQRHMLYTRRCMLSKIRHPVVGACTSKY